MQNWKKLILPKDSSVKDVITTLNSSGGAQVVLVTDQLGTLLGTITDGDLRRHMLTDQWLESKAEDVMHKEYLSVGPDVHKAAVLKIMREHMIRQIPVVDQNKMLLNVFLLNELIEEPAKHNHVLIMAGGLGKRLSPLTDNTPKPMLVVGGKPILQTIVENFIAEGFSNFVLAVNYLGDQIKEYFGDGERWGVSIKYLFEENRLGTAGAASLLPKDISDLPIIVTNGDVLTRVKYSHLLNFHAQNNTALTVCLRDHQIEIPFGVVSLQGAQVTGISEKPIENYHVSAGIYVMNPEVLNYLSHGKYKDMPELITDLIGSGQKIGGYPVHEYWADVGRHEELQLAMKEYSTVFN